jgi:ParB-like chromosome segregation protein Spo0J
MARKKNTAAALAPAANDSAPLAKIAKQSYKIVPIDSIQNHPKNYKEGDVDAIGESVERNDFYGACVVQKSTGFVLVGNHRRISAKVKGMKELPVIIIDCDDATAERIMLVDNRTAQLGSNNTLALHMLLEDQAKRDRGLVGTGYDEADLNRLRERAKAPVEVPKPPESVMRHTYTCPKCGHQS